MLFGAVLFLIVFPTPTLDLVTNVLLAKSAQKCLHALALIVSSPSFVLVQRTTAGLPLIRPDVRACSVILLLGCGSFFFSLYIYILAFSLEGRVVFVVVPFVFI